MNVIVLSPFDLALAALLILALAGLSHQLRIGSERQLLVAAARSTVQLLLIGLVLKLLFANAHPLWVGLLAAVMLAVAGREVMVRQKRRFVGAWGFAVGSLSMFVSSFSVPVADADSNGWPQTGRNAALREIRRGFAVHLAGDQHLGSLTRYGVDTFDDAGYAFCVPAIGNTFPRRWFPPEPGQHRKSAAPRYTGQYRDGFGNRMTVHAVSNPVVTGREPAALHDRAPGYGIVRFQRKTREITFECWPRSADPSRTDAQQYPGWPVTIAQADNYTREAAAELPQLKVSGLTDPVLQVVDESSGEIVYTLRMAGQEFQPRVFHPGKYSVKVGEPHTEHERMLRGLEAHSGNRSVIHVDFAR